MVSAPTSPIGLVRRSLTLAAVGATLLGLAATPAAIAQQPPGPLPPTVGMPLPPAPQLAPRPSGVRGRILRLAESQVGYHDHGPFCNRFGPCEVWCSLFATWAWSGAGVPIDILPFTGSVYDWAALNTFVLPPGAQPRPGDAVLYGTGPATVDSSVHIGIVEAAYPGYIVTIEGDLSHRVLRMVIPTRNPKLAGEFGRIYAYASPLPGARAAAAPAPLAPPLTGASLRRAIAHQDRLTLQGRRLRRSIRALRAFQHMPFHAGGITIEWTGVNSLGRVQVAVVTAGPLADAQAAWQQFLARYNDAGAAYDVAYYAPSA